MQICHALLTCGSLTSNRVPLGRDCLDDEMKFFFRAVQMGSDSNRGRPMGFLLRDPEFRVFTAETANRFQDSSWLVMVILREIGKRVAVLTLWSDYGWKLAGQVLLGN